MNWKPLIDKKCAKSSEIKAPKRGKPKAVMASVTILRVLFVAFFVIVYCSLWGYMWIEEQDIAEYIDNGNRVSKAGGFKLDIKSKAFLQNDNDNEMDKEEDEAIEYHEQSSLWDYIKWLFLEDTKNEVNELDIFTVIGVVKSNRTTLSMQILDQIREHNPKKIIVSSWIAPSKDYYDKWLEQRKINRHVPKQHFSAPVIFNFVAGNRIFLGGVRELLKYAAGRFPDVEYSWAITTLRQLEKTEYDPEASSELEEDLVISTSEGNLRQGVSYTQQAKRIATIEVESDQSGQALQKTIPDRQKVENEFWNHEWVEHESRIEADKYDSAYENETDLMGLKEIQDPANSGHQSPLIRSKINKYHASASLNKLPLPQIILHEVPTFAQLRLKMNETLPKITNYRPLSSSLVDRGWKAISYAKEADPDMILVQDLYSALHVVEKFPLAMLNNIGAQGQSCFGGSKGKQLDCRLKYTQMHGCNLNDLGIQPPQYRLWKRRECSQFFEDICSGSAGDRMWIEKPSGGSHGKGMIVHNGCIPIKKAHQNCSNETSRKRILIMPYITPPLLSGYKFDLRTFLLVASVNPHLVFYHDAIVRKADSLYSSRTSDLNAHITNSESQTRKDHFLSFEQLQSRLRKEHGFPPDFMENHFRLHAMKVQKFIFQVSKEIILRRNGSFQLFALDWIIDKNGGIHLLEGNSNPLVTLYPDHVDEYKRIWGSMIDLVLSIQTKPADILSSEHPKLTTEPIRYEYRGWHLIFNELEEVSQQSPYSPCKENFTQFDLNIWKQRIQHNDDSDALVSKLDPSGNENSSRLRNDDTTISSLADDVESEMQIDDISDETLQSRIDDIIQSHVRGYCHPINLTLFKNCEALDRGQREAEHAKRCIINGNVLVYFFPARESLEISPKACHPTAFVSAGAHGNEPAGVVAARHIRKTWRLTGANLIVIERLNTVGVAEFKRYIPRPDSKLEDLNRNFPASGPVGDLAREVWRLAENIRPVVFADLHEGWGVYKQLRSNYRIGEPLVGNPKFSKGSSVITSIITLPLAEHLVRTVNKNVVSEADHEFLAISPTIENGLARKMADELGSIAFVFETTSGKQDLYLRGLQHLTLLGALFSRLNFLPKNFNASEGFFANLACVAGSKTCSLIHPDDKFC